MDDINNLSPTNFHSSSIGVLSLVPAAVYFALCLSFTYVYFISGSFCWIMVLLCVGMSCTFMILPSKRPESPMFYVILGALCFVATVFGACFGHLNWSSNMSYYNHYGGQRTYVNVLPSQPALSHLDAGKIVFSSDSTIDLTKAADYKEDGSSYCLAPVTAGKASLLSTALTDPADLSSSDSKLLSTSSSQSSSKKVQFFAAGIDCCEDSKFKCNDYDDKKAHSGLVYLKFGDEHKLEHFRKAAQAYAANQGTKVSQDALFVKWVRDPDDAADSYATSGLWFLLGTSILYLVISVGVSVAIHFSHGHLSSHHHHHHHHGEKRSLRADSQGFKA